MSRRKTTAANMSSIIMEQPTSRVSPEAVEATREIARLWAVDDAEYEVFAGMLFGDAEVPD